MMFKLASLLFLLLAPLSPPAAAAPADSNVLVVLWDDLSADDTAATPELDSLRASGVSYSRFYTGPRCSPSRHSLTFGGAWVTTSGTACGSSSPSFAPQPSIATDWPNSSTLLIGKWHLGKHDTLSAPWEISPQLRAGYGDWVAGIPANVNVSGCGPIGNYTNWLRVESGVSSISTQYQTEAVELAALSAIATLPEPWLIVVCYQSPHKPFHVPPGQTGGAGETDRQLYERMVRDVDESTGRLIDAIDLDETLAFVISDNGTPEEVPWPGGPPGNKLKTTVFEGGIKVKAVAAGPGVPAGGICDQLAYMGDVRSMIDLRSWIPPGRGLIFVGTDFGGVDMLAVVGQRYKYSEQAGVSGLYDLLLDPLELNNLSGQAAYQAIESRLDSALDEMDPR